MDELDRERPKPTAGDRITGVVFLLLIVGLLIAEIVRDYHPVKLSALFIVASWVPLLVIHEAGHALAARLLDWRVLGIVLGAGPRLGRLIILGVPIEVRLVLVEGFVVPAPRHLRQVRWRSALIYLAGPAAELVVLAVLVFWLGLDTLLSASDRIGHLAAQSLVIAILLSVTVNLVPHPIVRAPEDREGPAWIANDGLGILRSFWEPMSHFAERIHMTTAFDDRDNGRTNRPGERRS